MTTVQTHTNRATLATRIACIAVGLGLTGAAAFAPVADSRPLNNKHPELVKVVDAR